MIKNLKVIVFVCLVLTITTYGQNNSNPTKDYIEKKFIAYSKDYPGTSINIIKNNESFYKKSIGKSDIKNGVSTTTETKFNIYSTSKFITGLAFLKLTADGIISMDQKIKTIDSSLPKSYDEITLGQLLSHTSGIRHYKNRTDWIKFAALNPKTPGEAIQYFINDPLQARPGSKEIYTTFGMVLASHLLEKITNKPFEQAINDLLPFSNPIYLDNLNTEKSVSYLKKGKKIEELPDLNAKSKYGGGGFIATADQLAEAGQFLFNNQLASLDEIKLLFKNQFNGASSGIAFATGGGISNESFGKSDVLYIAIGGGSPGGRSYLFVVADLKISVAVTANTEGNGDDTFNFVYDIIKNVAKTNK